MGGLLYERDLSSHTLTCPSFVFDVNWLNVNIIPQCTSSINDGMATFQFGCSSAGLYCRLCRRNAGIQMEITNIVGRVNSEVASSVPHVDPQAF